MKLDILFRVPLLLLFALLQCVTPVAHAHVDGNNADRNIHLPYAESPWLDGIRSSVASAYVAFEQDHSSIVCMPPEYRGNDLDLLPYFGSTEKLQVAQRKYVVVASATPPRQTNPGFPYQHPFSHAPPA